MRKFCVFIVSLVFLSNFHIVGQEPSRVYLDDSQPLEVRVENALSQMTIEEKVAMIHAQSKFSSAGVPRLGIPEVWMSDGPHGIREEVLWDEWSGAAWTNDSCIAFPALTCLAASWNPDVAALYGKNIGEEARYRNKGVLLGPGVNIYRTPLNGRNFEYMGEDPYLSSVMVVPYIREVQKNGVASCVKHFALNNQEIDRDHINVKVSDRALHEIYLPAFKAAVLEGGAWAIMGSYNQYKGQHCCHNDFLLNGILKKDWGFNGVVISDWGGVHDTKQAISNGLDMEFGSWTNGLNWGASNAYDSYYMAKPYRDLLKDGNADEEVLNDKVRRILRLVFRTTMSPNRPWGSFGTEAHGLSGRKIAEEGIVLLQNNGGLLPIDLSLVKTIAVIGENAVKKMTIGGGSSSLKAKYEISPLDGLKKRIGNGAEILYAQGYESYSPDWDGKYVETDPAKLKALHDEAVGVAGKADIVVFFGGLNKNSGQDSEGNDRSGLELPYGQDRLIEDLVKANPKMVVVIISGNAVAMPWVNNVPTIVEAWYGGSEAGNAIASVLVGDINPSGKLPFTFPVKLKDNSAHSLGEYPGDGVNVTYNEGIYVGYRWYEKEDIKPLFPFGHGLSYTTFDYGKVTVDKKVMSYGDKITCSVEVKNTGSRKGCEVVQMYISDKKSSLPRPVKELKGFSKISLEPGETKTVSFTIDEQDLSFYDDAKQKWVAETGVFDVLIGPSSADIKTRAVFELKK